MLHYNANDNCCITGNLCSIDVCGAWYMMLHARYMGIGVFGVLYTVFGVHDICCLEHVVLCFWCLVLGVWCLVFLVLGTWCPMFGIFV